VIRTFAPEWSAAEIAAVLRCVVRGELLGGGETERLEAALSELVGGQAVIATDSGRGALYAVLSGLNLPEGAEVIVPSLVCEVAVFPILKAGLRPVFVDCLDDLTLDPAEVAGAISPSTRVILMPHIYGKICHIEAITGLARRHSLVLIDDAAQVVGGRYASRALGTFGDFGIFSFNYKQICSTMGGAIVVSERQARLRAELRPRRFRRSRAVIALSGSYMAVKRFTWRQRPRAALHAGMTATGVSERAEVEAVDVGAMSNLCAAIARAQLKSLARRRQQRINQAEALAERLSAVDEVEITRATHGDLFTRLVLRVRAGGRELRPGEASRRPGPAEALVRFARRSGIEFQRIYPPFHLRVSGHKPLPRAEKEYSRCVVVPNHALLNPTDLSRIASVIKRLVPQMRKETIIP